MDKISNITDGIFSENNKKVIPITTLAPMIEIRVRCNNRKNKEDEISNKIETIKKKLREEGLLKKELKIFIKKYANVEYRYLPDFGLEIDSSMENLLDREISILTVKYLLEREKRNCLQNMKLVFNSLKKNSRLNLVEKTVLSVNDAKILYNLRKKNINVVANSLILGQSVFLEKKKDFKFSYEMDIPMKKSKFQRLYPGLKIVPVYSICRQEYKGQRTPDGIPKEIPIVDAAMTAMFSSRGFRIFKMYITLYKTPSKNFFKSSEFPLTKKSILVHGVLGALANHFLNEVAKQKDPSYIDGGSSMPQQVWQDSDLLQVRKKSLRSLRKKNQKVLPPDWESNDDVKIVTPEGVSIQNKDVFGLGTNFNFPIISNYCDSCNKDYDINVRQCPHCGRAQ